MKRILTIAFALTLVASSVFAGQDRYGWTVSASITDADVNTAASAPGVYNLYLWLGCSDAVEGWASAEFTLAPAGLFSVLAYTPLNGSLNVGSTTDLLIAMGGCTVADQLVGNILCLDSGGGGICIVPTAGNSIIVTVDCDPDFPEEHASSANGFATTGQTPCEGGDCDVISIDDSSWGSVKGLYR